MPYQKVFMFFCFFFFCSQVFIFILNIWPNIGLTYAISIAKGFFNCYLKQHFLHIIVFSRQFCENFRKFEQN